LPGAIRPTGTYTVEGKAVKVKLLLRRDGKTVATLPVEGGRDDLDGLVEKLAQAIAREVAGKK
jgi:hypothetical protein